MDPYKVLGIAPGATDEEIKRAYRNLSRKYHPDANVNNPDRAQAEEKFKEVQMAYDQIMKQKQQGYYSAIANAGSGNNVTAKEHASQAVNMEPSNMEYRQLQQQLEFGGTWYQSRGGEYERPYSGSSGWCMSMLLLNLLCNCCCFRPY